MDAQFLAALFQSNLTIVLPLGVFLVLTLAYIPCLLAPDAKPMAVGQAVTCYMLKTIGVGLMIMGLLPVVFNLMSSTLPEKQMMLSLILIFVTGLGLVVYCSIVVDKLDEASVVVIRSIFCHGFEVIGLLLSLFAALWFLISLITTDTLMGWQLPATLLLVGITLMLLFSLHISERRRKHGKTTKAKKK